jgi:hypothetical protein
VGTDITRDFQQNEPFAHLCSILDEDERVTLVGVDDFNVTKVHHICGTPMDVKAANDRLLALCPGCRDAGMGEYVVNRLFNAAMNILFKGQCSRYGLPMPFWLDRALSSLTMAMLLVQRLRLLMFQSRMRLKGAHQSVISLGGQHDLI